MYLLDTNVISEVRKGARCAAPVSQWYAQRTSEELYLSVLVLGEIWQGISLVSQRDPAQAKVLGSWYQDLKTAFGGRVLAVSEATAERWAELSAKRPYSVLDAMLAATAQVHDLILVTRNVKDIEGTGTRYVNPFEGRRVRVAT